MLGYKLFGKLVNDSFFKFLKSIPATQKTTFRGWVENAILAVVYLLERNPKECYIITGLRERLKKKTSLFDITFEDVGLFWKYLGNNKYVLVYPGNSKAHYICHLKTCMNKLPKSRFIITILNITVPQGQGLHANILLFDRELGILERFDPYNVSTQVGKLDQELEALYREHIHQDITYISPPDLSFFDKSQVGLQYLQEMEQEWKTRNKKGYPSGFCMPFTILYADTRMSFPDQSPESIPQIFKKFVQTENTTLTSFMRHYSEFLNIKFRTIINGKPQNIIRALLELLENHSASILTDLDDPSNLCSNF